MNNYCVIISILNVLEQQKLNGNGGITWCVCIHVTACTALCVLVVAVVAFFCPFWLNNYFFLARIRLESPCGLSLIYSYVIIFRINGWGGISQYITVELKRPMVDSDIFVILFLFYFTPMIDRQRLKNGVVCLGAKLLMWHTVII